MIKIGTIEFDDCILDSLHDNKLVVFAGAGISMGPPSNLPSFWKLVCDIAQDTGLQPTEPLDRFLGQLNHNKVAIHERAVQLLSPIESAPNSLHHDILRLFRTVDCVRLVTTNFDLHFETAANTLFGTVPDIYNAPALPLGYDFSGIVHIHGALPHSRSLVLTDADFGRAYLTEGWARRFLVDVFRHYTVLFVGYSHNDIVMNYLARALPAGGSAGRFALTDEDGSWELLGIKPIRFIKGSGNDEYKELYDGIQRLVERTTRGILDWQSRLAELANHAPPTDEEAISEVKQALREVHTTRFLLSVARDPTWIRWLHAHKYLDTLFALNTLGEISILLARWLAKNFTIDYSNDIFEILSLHGLQMNPVLWEEIARVITLEQKQPLAEPLLKRWVSILLTSIPANMHPDHHILMWLAECCSNQGCSDLTLKIFMTMSQYRLRLKPSFRLPDNDVMEHNHLDAECLLCTEHWPLNEVWTKYLKPLFSQIAQPLLSGITLRLEEIHVELTAWDKASREWDPINYRRSAIEPHEQDQYPEAVDVLIDAARDSLEWLAGTSPIQLDTWIERLIISDVPLLRRLAIHAVTVHPTWSSEESLQWLINRAGLHNISEHHEIYRAVALNYVNAADSIRQIIIDTILAHTLPKINDLPADMLTARSHFDWLTWLLNAKPDCRLAKTALIPITERYPEWEPSEHPDFTHWMGIAEWKGSESPWSIEQLLARPPHEQLDDLLSFHNDGFDEPNREGLLTNCREACKQNNHWGFNLGQALLERELWTSDLWAALIQGLKESEMTAKDWLHILALVSNQTLLATQSYEISTLLYTLVRDGGKPFSLDVLEQANTHALTLWKLIQVDSHNQSLDDWLSRAINNPAGVIVEFWINGLSLLMHGKNDPRFIPTSYLDSFNLVIQDATSKGDLGRCILCSQVAFLFSLDRTWTQLNIIPLFTNLEQKIFSQAWDGFLAWGRLYPSLVDELLPAFIMAMPRIATELRNNQNRFIEFYTALAIFHVSDPMQKLIPELFIYGSLENRVSFASQIGYFLRQMQDSSKSKLWKAWLHRYFKARSQGVLSALTEVEIRKMLEWLPHIGDAFPDAVTLIINGPKIQLEHSHFLYELSESDLVKKFPIQSAELLIFITNGVANYHCHYLENINNRLTELPEQTRLQLDEALARIGVPRH